MRTPAGDDHTHGGAGLPERLDGALRVSEGAADDAVKPIDRGELGGASEGEEVGHGVVVSNFCCVVEVEGRESHENAGGCSRCWGAEGGGGAGIG